jgi:hypothetical protein
VALVVLPLPLHLPLEAHQFTLLVLNSAFVGSATGFHGLELPLLDVTRVLLGLVPLLVVADLVLHLYGAVVVSVLFQLEHLPLRLVLDLLRLQFRLLIGANEFELLDKRLDFLAQFLWLVAPLEQGGDFFLAKLHVANLLLFLLQALVVTLITRNSYGEMCVCGAHTFNSSERRRAELSSFSSLRFSISISFTDSFAEGMLLMMNRDIPWVMARLDSARVLSRVCSCWCFRTLSFN